MAKAKLKVGDNVFPAHEISSDLNSIIHNEYLMDLGKLWNKYANVDHDIRGQRQLILLQHILGYKCNGAYLYGVVFTDDEIINPSPYLVGALKNLISMAKYTLPEYNSDKRKIEEQKQEIDKFEKENAELEASNNFYKRHNSLLAEKNSKLNAELDKLKAKTPDIEELQAELEEVKTDNDTLQEEIKKLKGAKPAKSLPAPTDTKLEEENKKLKSKNQEYKEKLRQYKKLEKELIPIMVDTIYCTRKKGKSISLEISQIENIFSDMLKNKSKSEISKKYHIARSTITKVWNIDYTTSNSLKKINYALHTVNGNWGDERKKILKNKISLCQEKLEQAKYLEENSKAELKEQISGLSEFVAALKEPKQEKYDKAKRSKNGSRVVMEDLEMDVEEFIYPFDEVEDEEEFTI